jgi:hypothetical protein
MKLKYSWTREHIMLGNHDVELILVKTDTDMLLFGNFRVQWLARCMQYVKDVEVERLDFEKDGHNLDIFLCSQIEECTEAALEMIRQGHRPEFALFYGKELFTEDPRHAIFNTTEALRKFGKESGDRGIVYNDAYSAALKQGKSKHYAQRYARAMNDEPWEEHAHTCAQAYEDAWNEALQENHEEEYCRIFAEMVSYNDYDRSHCRLHAQNATEVRHV